VLIFKNIWSRGCREAAVVGSARVQCKYAASSLHVASYLLWGAPALLPESFLAIFLARLVRVFPTTAVSVSGDDGLLEV